jgi:outer membrane protein assembly factor BamB
MRARARIPGIALAAALAASAPSRPVAADWLEFRGPGGSGAAGDDELPVSWGAPPAAEGAPAGEEGKGSARAGERNIAWKAALPGRGVSSPIVVQGRVFVTASSGFRQDRLHALLFDAASGKRLWERQFWASGQTQCHPKTCMAAPTPTSDGERLYAFYSTNDVFAFDFDGNLLWLRGLTHDYPNAANSVGMCSSLVVAGGTLVVQVENDADSFAAGLDVATGANRWKIPRPAQVNWTSPIVLPRPDGAGSMVVLQSGEGPSAHDPATGYRLWSFAAAGQGIPSVAAADGVLYVPTAGLTALRLAPETLTPEVVWESKRLGASTPSPVIHRGRVYVLSGSILKCADAMNGELLWQLRVEGPFSSTPVASGGHLYLFNEDGVAQVVKLGEEPGKEGVVAGTSHLGESVLSTPAVAGGALFVRTDGHLWKIARS